MYDTIAVAVNDRGAPSPLDRPCSVLLFERTASTWEAHTEIPFALSVLDSPFFVRDKVAALIAALGTCRIIAGGPVTGLAFHALDRAGFSIFEID
ncbi:MAG: Fe-only nitrogenase accessory AnfO family protein, partial [Acetanaerobacterium sp.]